MKKKELSENEKIVLGVFAILFIILLILIISHFETYGSNASHGNLEYNGTGSVGSMLSSAGIKESCCGG